MPTTSHPLRQHCPACQWQGAVFAPKSDSLSPTDFAGLLECCPKCGHAALELQPASALASTLSAVLGHLTGK